MMIDPSMKRCLAWLKAPAAILMLAMAMLLTACGGGSGASGENGEVVIGLTDAEGDFVNYEVDVTSIRLTKANGAEIETLPVSTRIDFAQYVDMTEFVTAATIPSGLYTHASLELDYSNANIQVEDAGGEPVQIPADNIVDGDGNKITSLSVRVRLDGQRSLVIVPGVPAHLTLDFDLLASNKVDTGMSPPVVTVEPFLLADVDPEQSKIHRLRGPLAEVNETEETFKLAIRPFHHPLDNHDHDFGRLTVVPGDTTVYEINGETAEGSAGFALLAQQPLLTAVIVLGELNISQRVFEAREVYAGSSVPGGTLDAMRGTVIARNGDVLTVRGATLMRANGAVVLNADVQVTVDASTRVTKQAVATTTPPDKDDISIGQLVTVFGEVTGSAPSSLAIDATGAKNGLVRMHVSAVTGSLLSLGSGEIVLDVQRINGRPVRIFDFTGTGTTPSDPSNYRIATGSLGLGGLTVGDPLRVLGFVTAFGMAPPDFEALTIIDVGNVNARMVVNWSPPATAPFISMGGAGLELDLGNAGPVHHVFQAGVATVLTASPAPVVAPHASGSGLYAIRQNRTVTLHTQFDNFISDLDSRLDGVTTLSSLVARGAYDSATQMLTSRRVRVSLQ